LTNVAVNSSPTDKPEALGFHIKHRHLEMLVFMEGEV